MSSSNSLPPAEVQGLLAGAAVPPPTGQTSQFGDKSLRMTSEIITFSITVALSTAAVLVRLFTQHFVFRRLSSEDYILIIASIFQFANAATVLVAAHDGSGQHLWNLTLREYIVLREDTYFFSILYSVCIACLKLAILLQFIRILAPSRVNRPAWLTCWICIVLNLLFYAISVLTQIFTCWPIAGSWNPFKAGHCLSIDAIYQSSAIFTVVLDVSILIIPMPIIFRLKMSTRKKLSVAAIFATGALACVASVLRAYYTWRVTQALDTSHYLWFVTLWCQIEMCAGFLIFCLPSFPQFYLHIMHKARGSLPATNSLLPSSDSAGRKISKQNPYDMPSLASFEERQQEGNCLRDGLSPISETTELPQAESRLVSPIV